MSKQNRPYYHINHPPFIVSTVLPEIDFSFIKKIFAKKDNKGNNSLEKSFQK